MWRLNPRHLNGYGIFKVMFQTRYLII